MVTRDITEGRGSATTDVGLAIAVDIGIVSSSAIWENTDISYDTAIGGLPFFYAISDNHPYIRQTAPFRKEQFDNGAEPGEQSLTGWWLRSQSSFHNGTGIKFYDPSAGETVSHRFADSENVDVWTKGEVTLLKETANLTGVTSGIYKIISIVDSGTDKILGWIPASTTIKNFTASGTANTYTHVTTIANPLDTAIFDITTDGTNLFISDNDSIYTGPISTPTAGYSRYYDFAGDKSRVVLGWVKQRLVACIDASVYELTGTKGSLNLLPTPLYTHPDSSWTWTSIAEGPSAIYVAGYSGGQSAIYKFVLSSSGVMPTLTSAITTAQFPAGEYVTKIEPYLGYLIIGTNKGVRVASIDINGGTGDLTYGPLIIEGSNIGLDFAFKDRFVYVTGNVNGDAGIYRIDLGSEIETLRFAWANDVFLDGVGGYATSVAFLGNDGPIAFTTSTSNGIAIQSTSTLSASGYLKTGNIRYGTLEPKNFRRVIGRGVFTNGSVTVISVTEDGTEYEHVTYDSSVASQEVSTTQPETAQEFIAFKFTFARGTTTTLGPTFKGYQAKATIATPRQRLLRFPVFCYDVETDRFNVATGYEGRALSRILALENAEANGDVLQWQDLSTSTGESRQVTIEEIRFTRLTPPDRRFDGFGGIIEITLRTV